MPLRAEAPEFVPLSHGVDINALLEECPEDSVTSEELEELEAVEKWVETMASIEEEEKDHLVMLALKYAPTRISAVHRRFSVRARKHQASKRHM